MVDAQRDSFSLPRFLQQQQQQQQQKISTTTKTSFLDAHRELKKKTNDRD